MKVKIVFASVDPVRDTPAEMKLYLSNFSADMIGVTAAREQDENFKKCLRGFKVYARKVNQQQNSGYYNMDHTSLVFLMSDSNQFLDIVNTAVSEGT